MKKHTLKVKKRDLLGRKVKKLRQGGILPANVFGKKVKSLALEVTSDEFKKVYKEVGETGLVELQIGEKDVRPVLIHNVQVGPVDDQILHVDFLQVDLKEKVTAEVPVEIVGESPAEKQGLGTVVVQIDEIEVEALPTDLPEKFEVDLSVLIEVDQAIYIKDIKVDSSKVTILDEPEDIVAKVEPLQKVEEVAPAPAEEVSVEGKEGTTPAEGALAPETEAEKPQTPKEE